MANYQKGLYNQLEEQILISEKLKKENSKLRAENRKWKNTLEKFMTDLDAKIEAAVGKAITPLKEEIANKDIEIAKANTEISRIRTHSNDRSTLYTVNPKKDILGIERDNILPRFHGILVHDHDKKYYHYGAGYGTCGAHLLRELKGLSSSSFVF